MSNGDMEANLSYLVDSYLIFINKQQQYKSKIKQSRSNREMAVQPSQQLPVPNKSQFGQSWNEIHRWVYTFISAELCGPEMQSGEVYFHLFGLGGHESHQCSQETTFSTAWRILN